MLKVESKLESVPLVVSLVTLIIGYVVDSEMGFECECVDLFMFSSK